MTLRGVAASFLVFISAATICEASDDPLSTSVCALKEHPEQFVGKLVSVHGAIKGPGIDIGPGVYDADCPNMAVALVASKKLKVSGLERIKYTLFLNIYADPKDQHYFTGTVTGIFGWQHSTGLATPRFLAIKITDITNLAEIAAH